MKEDHMRKLVFALIPAICATVLLPRTSSAAQDEYRAMHMQQYGYEDGLSHRYDAHEANPVPSASSGRDLGRPEGPTIGGAP
jgi:hypothetical protein